jgi:creatinine amidohydrolase
VSRPGLARQDRAGQESGADQNRLDLPGGVYTGIWWYAKFPNYYAGDGSAATTELADEIGPGSSASSSTPRGRP